MMKKSQIVTRKDMHAQKKRYEPIESLGIPHFWLQAGQRTCDIGREFRDIRELFAVKCKEYGIRHKVARVQTDCLTCGGIRQVLLRKERQGPTWMRYP